MRAEWLDVRFVDRLRAGDADGALRLIRGWEPAALRRLAAVIADAALPLPMRETAALLLPAAATEAGCPREPLCSELNRLGGAVAEPSLAARLLAARLDQTAPGELEAVLATAVERAGGRDRLDEALRDLPPTPSTLRARLRLGGAAAATTALATLADAPPADLAVALAAIATTCPTLEDAALAPLEALLAALPIWSDADADADADAAADDDAADADAADAADLSGTTDAAELSGAVRGSGAAPAALLPLALAEAALAFRLLARAATAERAAEVLAMAPPTLAPVAFAALRGEPRGAAIAAAVAADPRFGATLRRAAAAAPAAAVEAR